MSKHLYLLSGMGSDERVFQHMTFPDQYTLHFLPWLTPLPEETLAGYASRMTAHIPADEDITLVGVSMGGILALEIARQRPVRKVVLISSIKTTAERPLYFNLVRRTRLLALLALPDAVLFGKHRNLIIPFFLKAESPAEKELLLDYVKHTDFVYLRWAIKILIGWENEEVPAPLVHIHGGKDLTLPIATVKADYVIPDGGHFMVYNRAGEISAILKNELT